ncbi:4-(cytidine 5'-diphospho)-2-C-methyl-D-erythritol kinase [Candidatus Schneideria nysicola]|uniref:4-(cytidine 5'-diphospho)-2-C-methyl-D-erythritol kinase n=1 Tax=Candidatus Schneideria nysicola TaxID=1081631 RepID=UPI001CAA6C41|nr:4-(cytidine 5'-diphospho)-2-C-methyl-D-erythritol kinase [Candidatus Schneideria nysicola]UAJ65636.1 4-(cytidine 5'-diphospho)-2-C-methyl-D-erythritol kinase [Candidatus Schneideria nysicola]
MLNNKWIAPAKINLFLYITGRKKNGYHLLQTLYQFLNYGDILTINSNFNGRIQLIHNYNFISDEKNLIIRAAHLLKNFVMQKNKNTLTSLLGANISLKKVIPIGGGLGGGSSNAATVLIALNKQWKLNLNLNILANIGLKLGADVPFFIRGKSAFAEGIGDCLLPIFPKEKWYIITVPPINISTADIFNDPNLKRNSPRLSLLKLLVMPFKNDCELIVRKRFVIVDKHISWLLKHIPSSRLTGTGSCILSEFDTEDDARKILSLFPNWMYGFIAKSTNISPLHKKFLIDY